MRISSGSLKGRVLASPKDASIMRPTSEKVRAAVFSSLGEIIVGARFLDVFAGTGAMGIEAYSRGASHITFVEKQPQTLSANVKLIPDTSAYKIIAGDVFTVKLTGTYDIIYLDPPYATYDSEQLLLHMMPVLADGGVIVLEEATRKQPAAEAYGVLKCTKERRYGDTMIQYWEKE
ncbi:MAG: 16S rRNA (guanine(966)-N(2))-methyltransferase RsmD [Deferribacteraceae bacterium]|jgi:16S rRNA (guanine(966)-N(2))-methyltransferase RsmD|nr:16S rRNA (guanine(966)-N(2))-methyltransferase RsmD [Deferribacteraceae bacterium]